MAKLAIKGHATRGKEVIEILEMLGGVNRYHRKGNVMSLYYYIGSTTHIYSANEILPTEYFVFTLEEFLEKYPYKVGDKVKCWINGYCSIDTIKDIQWDSITNEIKYKIQDYWYSTMNLQPYEEETIGESIDKTNKVIFEANAQSCDIMNDIIKEEDIETITIDDFKANTKEWLIDKLESMSKDNALQTINNIYDELYKPKYPKTYEECCEVLGIGSYFEPEIRNATTEECHIFMKLMRLKRCRDAYWKIAGKEMGLGKPWEPDWKKHDKKYIISVFEDAVIYFENETYNRNAILAFPTEEMRDTYKENFDNDIEVCKEFL